MPDDQQSGTGEDLPVGTHVQFRERGATEFFEGVIVSKTQHGVFIRCIEDGEVHSVAFGFDRQWVRAAVPQEGPAPERPKLRDSVIVLFLVGSVLTVVGLIRVTFRPTDEGLWVFLVCSGWIALFSVRQVLQHRRRSRRRDRFRRGLCLNCGYDLTGNESGVCPECGETASQARSPDTLGSSREE